MDFDKSEILNPNIVTIAPYVHTDANDAFFDGDNDLLVSVNGVVIDFPKPIENYQWIDVEIENVAQAQPGLVLKALTNNQGLSDGFFVNSTLQSGLLNFWGHTHFRIPNIGTIERLRISGIAGAGNFIAVKSIRVATKSNFYAKQASAAIIPVMPAGWVLNSNGIWEKTMAIGSSDNIQVACTFASLLDFLNVHIYTYADDVIQCFPMPLDQHIQNVLFKDGEFDFSADPNIVTWPINIGVIAPINGGKVFIDFKYGSFPTPVNVFGASLSPQAPAPVFNPASPLVDTNNIWSGANTFNGQVNLNAGVKFGGGTGYVKALAGVLSVVAGVAVADITGAGNILTHNVAEFFQVGNNLAEGIPATMRGNLGLGTAATHAHVEYLLVANSLSDVANVVAARANLGLTSTAILPEGTWAKVANNLSDLTNAATARGNLGLGTIATQNANGVVITGGTVNATVIGGVTPAAGNFSTLSATGLVTLPGTSEFSGTGELGVRRASATDRSIYINAPSSAATQLYGIVQSWNIPITVNVGANGYYSDISTLAAVYNAGNIIHFTAANSAKGAGSTINAVYGFVAQAAIANGTSNYGFYSALAAGANTYNFYGVGTAQNYFGGPIGILTNNPLGNGSLFQINGTHPATNTSITVQNWDVTAPSTVTSQHVGADSTLRTANAAFTTSQVFHFLARQAIKGAANTITNLYGFYIDSNSTVGANNYGFYSGINTATNTWQIYAAGTADSFFAGGVGIGTNNPTANSSWLIVNGVVPGTGTIASAVQSSGTFPATATSFAAAYYGIVAVTNSAFTCSNAVGFWANSFSKGALASVTNAYGFRCEGSISNINATNTYGFYSGLVAATNTFSFYSAGTASAFINGTLGVGTANAVPIANATYLMLVGGGGAHPCTTNQIQALSINYTLPTTATNTADGIIVSLTTPNSVFTVIDLSLFKATGIVKGASSIISNVYGFRAFNAIAVGAVNYGFYSDINAGTTTYAYYAAGSAQSVFNGSIGIIQTDPIGNAAYLYVGSGAVNHFTGAARGDAIRTAFVAPATMTASQIGCSSSLTTVNSAFTLTQQIHFFAELSTKGAANTITNVRGFFASNNIVVGSSNFGFYSDILVANQTYQFRGAGTAASRFDGPFGILADPGTALVLAGNTSNHPSTATTIYSYYTTVVAPSTATSKFTGYHSDLATAAAAFTVADIIHFDAFNVTKGAGSTITNIRGFYARNAIVAAGITLAAGFYSDITSATGAYQIYMAGTGACRFSGVTSHDLAIIEKEVTVTYSASMTIDASTGNEQIISANNATAFTINAPTNPATGQYLEITIRNTSAGALGVATWNAVFKMVAWVQPGTLTSRTITFRYNGTNWVEKGRTAADIPN